MIKLMREEPSIDEALQGLRLRRVGALERFKVEEIVILHRVGRLKVGETILIILVAAAHRDEAFKACRYVLEELKRRVPLWKREITPMGATWVEGESVEGR